MSTTQSTTPNIEIDHTSDEDLRSIPLEPQGQQVLVRFARDIVLLPHDAAPPRS